MTSITNSGWTGAWEDQIKGLLSKLDFLEKTGRYSKLLANLIGANDKNNFAASALEATIAYQFESAGIPLRYEIKQVADNEGSIDFCWKIASGKTVYIEVRLLQQDKATADSIAEQLNAQNAYTVLKDGDDEKRDIVRVQQVILEKVQKKDGTPTKFLTMRQDAINLVAVDISSIILGMFDFDDCKLAASGDPAVSDVNRRQVFGLFQDPKPEYPPHIQSLAQSFAHIRKTLHGVLFLFRKPKTELFNYSIKRFLAWNPNLIKEETAREISKELDAPLPVLKKKQQ